MGQGVQRAQSAQESRLSTRRSSQRCSGRMQVLSCLGGELACLSKGCPGQYTCFLGASMGVSEETSI